MPGGGNKYDGSGSQMRSVAPHAVHSTCRKKLKSLQIGIKRQYPKIGK